ncbi:MAG: hypothetical protein SGARI_006856 [Bacillariaceae sp.]
MAAKDGNAKTVTTPVSLHKIDHVIRASLIVKNSTFPKDLQESILGPSKKKAKTAAKVDNSERCVDHDDQDDDEIWPVEDIPDRKLAKTIPEEFLISTADAEALLNDDLITLCVVQFLPEEAFVDIFEDEQSSTRLDRSIIQEDAYLGSMVDEYSAKSASGSPSGSSKKRASNGDTGFPICKAAKALTEKIESAMSADKKQLSKLMTKATKSQQEEREIYGQTVRLEELSNLLALTCEIQQLVGSLDHSIQTA